MKGKSYKFDEFKNLNSKNNSNLFILSTEKDEMEMNNCILKTTSIDKQNNCFEDFSKNETLEIMDHLLFINLLNKENHFNLEEINEIKNRKKDIEIEKYRINKFKRKSQEEGFLDFNIHDTHDEYDIDLLPEFSNKKSKSQGKTTSTNEPLELLAQRRKHQLNNNHAFKSFDEEDIDPFSSDNFERVAYCDEFDSEIANKPHKNQIVINSIDDSSIFNIFDGI